jgi:hypothetical protein
MLARSLLRIAIRLSSPTPGFNDEGSARGGSDNISTFSLPPSLAQFSIELQVSWRCFSPVKGCGPFACDWRAPTFPLNTAFSKPARFAIGKQTKHRVN